MKSIILMSLFSMVISAEEILEVVNICHRNDPNVENCILNSIDNIRPYLIKGFPENGIPPIDPLVVSDIIISNRSQTGLGLSVNNVVITGVGQYKVSQLRYNKNDNIYEFLVTLPSLELKGEYDVNGEILRLPIKGHGPFTGEFSGVTGTVKLKAEIVPINGKNRMIIKRLRIKLRVSNGRIRAENLFNGDKILGDAINDLINSNFRMLTQSTLPLIERIVEQTMLEVGNTLASRYDYDQFFPE